MLSFSSFRLRKKAAPARPGALQRYRQAHRERVRRKQAASTRRIRISIRTGFVGRYRVLLLSAIAAVTLLFLAYLVFFSGVFSVSSVIVERDALTTNVPMVQNALRDVMGRNLLFIRSSTLQQRLREAFPEVKAFAVSRLLPRTVRVSITEYPVVARLKEQTTGTVWVLNEVGQVLRKETTAQLPLIEYRNAYQFPFADVGKQFSGLIRLEEGAIAVPQKDLRSILASGDILRRDTGMSAPILRYYPLERELHLRTDRSFTIWLDLDQEIEEQLARLAISAGQFNTSSSRLSYADLRVKNRIIYCLKGEACDRAEAE